MKKVVCDCCGKDLTLEPQLCFDFKRFCDMGCYNVWIANQSFQGGASQIALTTEPSETEFVPP
jgi:hypothetical protein